jgi:hypothetical protein
MPPLPVFCPSAGWLAGGGTPRVVERSRFDTWVAAGAVGFLGWDPRVADRGLGRLRRLSPWLFKESVKLPRPRKSMLTGHGANPAHFFFLVSLKATLAGYFQA